MSQRQAHHHQHRRNHSTDKKTLKQLKEDPQSKEEKVDDKRISLMKSPSKNRSHASLLYDNDDPKKINLTPEMQSSRAQSPFSKNNDSKGKILFSDDNIIPSALIDSSDALDENYREMKNYDIPPVKPPPAVMIKDFKRPRSSKQAQGEAPPLKIVEGSSQIRSLAYRNHKVIPLPPTKGAPQLIHKEEKKKARSNDPEQAQFVPAPLLVLGDEPNLQNPEINEELIELEPEIHRHQKHHHHRESSDKKGPNMRDGERTHRRKRSEDKRSKSETPQARVNEDDKCPCGDHLIHKQSVEKETDNKYNVDVQRSSKKKKMKRSKKRSRSGPQKEESQKEIPTPIFIEAKDSSSFDGDNQNIIERLAQPNDDTPKSLPSPKREEPKKQLSFKERVGLLKMGSIPKLEQESPKKDSADDILIGRLELPPIEEENSTPQLPNKQSMPPLPKVEDGSELYGPVITEIPTTEAGTNVFASYATTSSKNIVYDDMVRRGINPVKPIESFHSFQVPIIPGPDDSLLEKEAVIEFDLKLLMKNARS